MVTFLLGDNHLHFVYGGFYFISIFNAVLFKVLNFIDILLDLKVNSELQKLVVTLNQIETESDHSIYRKTRSR